MFPSRGSRGAPPVARNSQRSASRGRAREPPSLLGAFRGRGTNDPFGLDGELFEFVTHHENNGETFAGYRVRGHAMILHSLVDGSALASLHLRVTSPEAHALITRRPDCQGSFQGIVSADNVNIELVMTNLTTEDALLFDIGGVPRAREDKYWDCTDVSFWSERHRNDARLNKSNILWPMLPNTCAENNLHFLETGEHRSLRLCIGDRFGAVASTGPSADPGYPIYVYSRFNSRTALKKFERTAWSCPETIVVIGTPAMIADVGTGRNIHRDDRNFGNAPESTDPVERMASAFGLSRERLLEILKVDTAFLAELPEDMQTEVLAQELTQVDPTLLKPPEDEPDVRASLTAVSSLVPTSATHDRSGPVALDTLALGARPAHIVAGNRVAHMGAGRVLVEKYDFARPSAPAKIELAVNSRVQLIVESDSSPQRASRQLLTDLNQRISELVAGHTESLRQEVGSVFSSSECVICLSGKPPPDVILFQCGHRCVHRECLMGSGMRRCPLCRSPIAALLPVEGK